MGVWGKNTETESPFLVCDSFIDWLQTISGTNTMYNLPVTPEAKLTDPMAFEPIHRNLTIGEPMDTVGGTPLCYVYEPW